MEVAEDINYYKEQLASLKDMMQRTTAYMSDIQAELCEKNREIEQSVSYAEGIQLNLLPECHYFEGFFNDCNYYLKQKDRIGGDLIYAKDFGDSIVFGLMDCTGHGIPGAMIAMMGYSFLHKIVNYQNAGTPGSILKKLDEYFVKFFKRSFEDKLLNDGMDGILLSYHKPTSSLKYSMAGRPLWYHSKGEWHKIKPDKNSIGGSLKRTFETHLLDLDKGDELFIFSDGLPDQFGGPKNKKFLTKRIMSHLVELQDLTTSKKCETLVNKIKEWQGEAEQTDDISFILLQL